MVGDLEKGIDPWGPIIVYHNFKDKMIAEMALKHEWYNGFVIPESYDPLEDADIWIYPIVFIYPEFVRNA